MQMNSYEPIQLEHNAIELAKLPAKPWDIWLPGSEASPLLEPTADGGVSDRLKHHMQMLRA
jgi:hypothetical protein